MGIIILILAVAAIVGGVVMLQRNATALGIVLLILGIVVALYALFGVRLSA